MSSHRTSARGAVPPVRRFAPAWAAAALAGAVLGSWAPVARARIEIASVLTDARGSDAILLVRPIGSTVDGLVALPLRALKGSLPAVAIEVKSRRQELGAGDPGELLVLVWWPHGASERSEVRYDLERKTWVPTPLGDDPGYREGIERILAFDAAQSVAERTTIVRDLLRSEHRAAREAGFQLLSRDRRRIAEDGVLPALLDLARPCTGDLLRSWEVRSVISSLPDRRPAVEALIDLLGCDDGAVAAAADRRLSSRTRAQPGRFDTSSPAGRLEAARAWATWWAAHRHERRFE